MFCLQPNNFISATERQRSPHRSSWETNMEREQQFHFLNLSYRSVSTLRVSDFTIRTTQWHQAIQVHILTFQAPCYLSEYHLCRGGGILTDLLVMLLGFKADDLQDAGVGDVRHNIRHALPHTQQSTTQHVVLTKTHALQTLLAFLDFLTLAIPTDSTEKKKLDILCIQRAHTFLANKANCVAGWVTAQHF